MKVYIINSITKSHFEYQNKTTRDRIRINDYTRGRNKFRPLFLSLCVLRSLVQLKHDNMKTVKLKHDNMKTVKLKHDNMKMENLKHDNIKTEKLKHDNMKTVKLNMTI